ncbi:hypothetical protein [Rubritalea profundi]|uniref:Uncharacterized protein n=1 Tax=Rubritalea profundi TaxID=1658618 RepID=A0A2S7U3Z0_9BACT|nr:hypothetical protein [Rubritalea profundi]PQJ29114.1 hypothetical protein BSZ32_11840 [Rubritalea profundi]
MLSGGEEEVVADRQVVASAIVQKEPNAEEVARAFIAEINVEKRLTMVRNREVVKTHLSSYTEEALKEPGVEIREMMRRTFGDKERTSYAVSFTSGSLRLLNVLETDEGPKVDWDSYARYCSVSWDTLTNGESVDPALVRVFVRPGSHYAGEYLDQKKWLCFQLETPDCGETLYAYGKVGEENAEKMKEIVLRAKNYRQHMTLELEAKGKLDGACLFEVKRLVTVGWVE